MFYQAVVDKTELIAWKWRTDGQAIASGDIKAALEIWINDEEDEFKDGVVFDKIPEVLIRGHALNKDRITKLEERALFSNYVYTAH